MVSALATGRTPEGLRRSLGIFVALATGAVLSALITTYQPALLPIVVLTPIALVIWLASARFGPRPAIVDQEP
jgi:predicted anti-sigma-YlaC factor YlaD